VDRPHFPHSQVGGQRPKEEAFDESCRRRHPGDLFSKRFGVIGLCYHDVITIRSAFMIFSRQPSDSVTKAAADLAQHQKREAALTSQLATATEDARIAAVGELLTLRSRRNANAKMAHTLTWVFLALGAIPVWAEPASAQQSPQARRGLIFVRLHCSQCHAIGKVGESPLPSAIPFRILRLRYPVADLQRPLLEGIHPGMPTFQLTPSQVFDVMAYLQTLPR
jgi:mono/diheme cytochrome c family protein